MYFLQKPNVVKSCPKLEPGIIASVSSVVSFVKGYYRVLVDMCNLVNIPPQMVY